MGDSKKLKFNELKFTREEIENALDIILKCGENALHDSDDNIKFGWSELTIGDFVYFKTYDDVNDNLTISKGEIIEIITSEKKVMNRPDDDMKSNGWHRERSVSYKIRWNGMTSIIDSRYVYVDKINAVVAAMNGTIQSYLELK